MSELKLKKENEDLKEEKIEAVEVVATGDEVLDSLNRAFEQENFDKAVKEYIEEHQHDRTLGQVIDSFISKVRGINPYFASLFIMTTFAGYIFIFTQ